VYKSQIKNKNQINNIQIIWKKIESETYIGSITNEFPKKDLLVGVKSVDDEAEKLVDLSLKSERLSF